MAQPTSIPPSSVLFLGWPQKAGCDFGFRYEVGHGKESWRGTWTVPCDQMSQGSHPWQVLRCCKGEGQQRRQQTFTILVLKHLGIHQLDLILGANCLQYQHKFYSPAWAAPTLLKLPYLNCSDLHAKVWRETFPCRAIRCFETTRPSCILYPNKPPYSCSLCLSSKA